MNHKTIAMSKKKTDRPAEIPVPGNDPEVKPATEPGNPLFPEEEPGELPNDDPYETPPYEIPEPGEGP